MTVGLVVVDGSEESLVVDEPELDPVSEVALDVVLPVSESE